MNQMQALLEKAKNDKELMAKMDALGAAGAGADKIVALAAEYGFSITEEDCRQAAARSCPQKSGELAEEDLEAVAGGTQNRYDPTKCRQYKEASYDCVGFLSLVWCDHYRRNFVRREDHLTVYWHLCAHGCFCYERAVEEKDPPGQNYG